MKAFDFFYYINGRFPTNNDLITALDGDIPDFIKIKLPGQKISPHQLFEMFRSKKSHVLVSTQFLSALNIFLGGNLQISKNGMAEFYHSLPIQALTHFMPLASSYTPWKHQKTFQGVSKETSGINGLSESNYEVSLHFTITSELIKSVNSNIQQLIYNHKKEKQKLKDNTFPDEKFELNQKIETVDAILKNIKIDSVEDYYKVSHFPQTAGQIQEIKKKRLRMQ